MKLKFDVTAQEYTIIQTILSSHLSSVCKVWVFGSRAKNTSRFNSDLDLALDCGSEIPAKTIATLKDAFNESKLAFSIDLVDMHRVEAYFKQIIDEQKVTFPLRRLVSELRFSEFSQDWEEKKLGEVSKYTKGFAFKSEDYCEQGTRIVKVSDLGADYVKNDNDKTYISDSLASNYDKYQLKGGNIIITTVGSKPELKESAVGRGIYVYKDNKGLLNQNLLKLENIEGVENKFLFSYVNTPKYINFISSISRGNANQANITVKELFEYKIYVATLPEQQKIATFLSAVDKKLGHLRRKHALLETYKRGIMQKLFSPFDGTQSKPLRFKQDNGADFPNWEEKRLGGLGKFYGGGTPSTSIEEYWNGDISWVSSSDIDEGNIHNISITRFINESAIKDSATKLIPKNSILLVSRVGVGKLAVSENEVCTSQDFSNFNPDTDDVFYLAYFLLSNKNKLLSFSQGTSIKGFTSSDISSLKVNLPCKEEQQKIANFLSTLDKKLEAVQKQIDQAELFKKGLLQKMFV